MTEKYIFLSDIHLGDQNSYTPVSSDRFPYGWTNKHTADLSGFLKELEVHPETKNANGLVIVGDLLDVWVCPSQLNPPSFDDVLTAEHNSDVIAGLNTVADNGNLMYIPGNHDMLVDQKTLKKHIKNINIVGPTTGHLSLYNNHLVAEHGHEYCLFNAVDTWDRPSVDGRLPLGFFMARLAAEGVFEKNCDTNYLEILKELIKKFSPSTEFAIQIMNALKNYELNDVGVEYIDPIIMNHVDYFPEKISYNDAINIYANLFDEWDKYSKSGIPATIAALSDGVGLRSVADIKYLAEGVVGGPVKIVIFGHTHEYEIKTGLFLKDTSSEDLNTESSDKANVIYGNCGAWIDTKPCTFIVTEQSQIDGKMRIDVSGYEYIYDTAKRSGTISQKDTVSVTV